MLQLLAVSAVGMGLSYTISKEAIFAALRDRCGGRDTFLGYLISCPYCLSHWLAFAIVPLTGSYYVKVDPHLPHWIGVATSWFFSAILVTVVAAFLRVIFFFVDETQGLVRKHKKTVEQVLEQEAPKRELGPEVQMMEPPIH
jgi:hypothetical protein